MFIIRLLLVLAVSFLIFAAPGLAQQAPSELPTETDTVRVGRPVVLSIVQGTIFKKTEEGKLVPLKSRATIKQGDMLLVLKGAAFKIGRTQIGPEYHGDRWVQFE